MVKKTAVEEVLGKEEEVEIEQKGVGIQIRGGDIRWEEVL